jgi:hypothetical protein
MRDESEGQVFEGVPSVTVTYADGSEVRIIGAFDQSTVADVARLITYDTARDEESEDAEARRAAFVIVDGFAG